MVEVLKEWYVIAPRPHCASLVGGHFLKLETIPKALSMVTNF